MRQAARCVAVHVILMSARNVAATALEETEKSLTFLCLIKA